MRLRLKEIRPFPKDTKLAGGPIAALSEVFESAWDCFGSFPAELTVLPPVGPPQSILPSPMFLFVSRETHGPFEHSGERRPFHR